MVQIIYDFYEVLSPGIFVGPGSIIIGAFFWKKRKMLAKVLITFGVIYLIIAAALIFHFVQEEKKIIKLREQAEQNK